MFVRFKLTNNDINNILGFFEDKSQLIFYIDFKNSVFRPHKKSDMESLNPKECFSSILYSALNLISQLKQKFKSKKIRIFFYGENGKCGYHTAIFPNYKAKRQKDSLNRVYIQNINNIIHLSSQIGENILNFIPNVNFIYSNYFEIDMFPFVIMKSTPVEHTGHIILSSDKDNFQIIQSYDNVLIYDKGIKNSKMFKGKSVLLNQGNYYIRFTKDIDLSNKYGSIIHDNKLLVFQRAIEGDASDDVRGVKGVGAKYAPAALAYLVEKNALRDRKEILKELILLKNYKKISNINIIKDDFEFDESTVADGRLRNAIKKVLSSQDIIVRNLLLFDYNIIYYRNRDKMKELIAQTKKYDRIKNPFKLAEFLDQSGVFMEEEKSKMNYIINNLI